MYESYFSLREPPFSVTPDPRFVWLSPTAEEGLAALYYGIQHRKGFILLTGEVGSGKTTLLRAVLRCLPREDLDIKGTAMIMNTAELTPLDLLKLIAVEFQIDEPIRTRAETRADYIIGLDSFLLRRMRDGLNTVLIIDEAQNLDPKALEQVRLLSNLETESEKLLQIVLSGQPELRQKLAAPGLEPLCQRIAIEHHVDPLQPDEVLCYLRHRIQVAGGRYEEMFDPGCDKTFARFSAGRPRVINILADRVLLAAYARRLRPVPETFVKEKAQEMIAALAVPLLKADPDVASASEPATARRAARWLRRKLRAPPFVAPRSRIFEDEQGAADEATDALRQGAADGRREKKADGPP